MVFLTIYLLYSDYNIKFLLYILYNNDVQNFCIIS